MKNKEMKLKTSIMAEKNKAKEVAQAYVIKGVQENLMGIKNKAKIGNL